MMPPTSIDGTDITGATIDGTDVQEITVDGQTVFTAGPSLLDSIFMASSFFVAGGADYRGMSFTPTVNTITQVKAVLGDSGNGLVYPTVDLSNVDTSTILQTKTGPFNEGDTVVFNHSFTSGTEFGVAVETEDGTNNYANHKPFENGTSSVADVTGRIAYLNGGSIGVSTSANSAIGEFQFFG